MGRGIAQCLLQHGFHVIALDPAAEFERENLTRASSAAEFKTCELIIETITEDFAAKQALYDQIEEHVDGTVPITSNTSGFPITRLQAPRRYPERFAGMHWASPAYATLFLEIIRGERTDDETIRRVDALARQLGKEPGLVKKDLPGFALNRIAYAMYREALHLVEEGVASMEDIDALCRNSIGLWMPVCGPFQWIDISGGPPLYGKVMETILPTLSIASEPPQLMQRNSFYEYDPGEQAELYRKLEDHALKVWSKR